VLLGNLPLTLSEGQTLGVLENMVLKKALGSKEEEAI
jgi:hypothetical protein